MISDLDAGSTYASSSDVATNTTKLAGIAAGATVNDTDANLKNRANHTGTQLASTISDFDTAVSSNAAVADNTAKVTNATHTGDVTGADALTIADNAVTAAKISSTDTTFNVGTNVGIGAVSTGFKLNVDTGTANSGLQVTGAVASGTLNNFLVNTNTTGTGTLLRFQSALTGSIANLFHLDLQSNLDRMAFGFVDGDGIGVIIENSNGGVGSETGSFIPVYNNKTTLGKSAHRWSVVYAGSGTINTSDRNQKEEIEELAEAELRVAQACKGLVRKFKFKGGTRKHIGVIAQDVRDVFSAEGLDAHEYGLFCSDTWTDEDTGEEVTQLGIRYEELLAFIISAL